jgi:hypothetical protein
MQHFMLLWDKDMYKLWGGKTGILQRHHITTRSHITSTPNVHHIMHPDLQPWSEEIALIMQNMSSGFCKCWTSHPPLGLKKFQFSP